MGIRLDKDEHRPADEALDPGDELEALRNENREIRERIAELKREEAALRRSERHKSFRLGLADTLRSLSDPADIRMHTVRAIGEHVGANRVYFAEPIGDAGQLVVSAEFAAGVPSWPGRRRLDDYGLDAAERIRTGHTVVSTDVARDPRLSSEQRDAWHARSVGAFLVVALQERGTPRSVLAIHFGESRHCDERDVSLALETAERASSAVERAQSERRLVETRDLLKMATEASHLGWVTWDHESGAVRWDARGRAIAGPSEGGSDSLPEALGRIYPADRSRVRAHILKCIAEKHDFNIVCRLGRSATDLRYVHVTGMFEFGPGGRPARGTGFVRDVTEEKVAEESLQRMNELLEERVSQRTRQVRDLAARLTTAENQERRRISRILHDDLQQVLYGIQMKVLDLRTTMAPGNDAALEEIDDVRKWLDHAIETTRHLTVDLSPPVLQSEGLVDALEWLCVQMDELYGLQIDVRASHAHRLREKHLEVLLFQIIRELLFNVVKHAGTDHAVVELEDAAGEVVVHVMDQGRGFDRAVADERDEAGFGLFSARERLGLVGGSMAIDSHPGAGTRITVRAPTAFHPFDPENRS